MTAETKICALIVLYKQNIEQSETLKSISDAIKDNPELSKNYKFLIWDNSPQPPSDLSLIETKFGQADIEYVSCPENIGLSSIYNSLTLREPCANSFLLLDQDSNFSSELLIESMECTKNGLTLCLPIVLGTRGIYSPARRFYCFGKHFNAAPKGEVCAKNLLGINSGMLISRAVLEKIKYDERLHLYCVDTDFMVKYEKIYDSAWIMRSIIHHDLAIEGARDNNWKVSYFRSIKESLPIIFNSGVIERLVAVAYGTYLGIRFRN